MVDVVVRDKVIRVSCGCGTQRVKWLGYVGICRYEKNAWKELGVPTRISRADGTELEAGATIREVLRRGETVFVTHR